MTKTLVGLVYVLSHQVQLLNVLSQTFDPKKCISVEMALCHLYLEAYHNPDDEPVSLLLDLELFEFSCSMQGSRWRKGHGWVQGGAAGMQQWGWHVD